MDQFVCVRLVQVNTLDLSLFQFDPDLTFAVFLLNADRTIYGRFGTRSDFKQADRDISLEGLRKAMRAALELHQNYPANKAALVKKTGPKPRFKTPNEYPWVIQKGINRQHCMHCHHVGNAEQMLFRTARKAIPDHVLFPWPMPDAVGLKLDPKEKARVQRVLPHSAAKRAGFRANDEILTFAGQPMLSIADVQWVLHNSKGPSRLIAEVLRDGKKATLTLSLGNDWRRRGELSWRTTTWNLRRMGTGGLVLEDLPNAARRKAGLSPTELALRVKHVGQFGEHAAAKRAGFKNGDIVVAFDGRTKRMTESSLLAYVVQKRMPGARVPVTVLRAGKRLHLTLPMQ